MSGLNYKWLIDNHEGLALPRTDHPWSPRKNSLLNQGCVIPMPYLSDSGLFVGGQVDFTR